MSGLEETAHWIVTNFGNLGLFLGLFLEFLGLPFPGEISQAFAGFLIVQGHLRWEITVPVCILGSQLGSLTAHLIGYRFGRDILDKWGPYIGLKPKYIVRTEAWLQRNKIAMILLSRYVIGVRHVTPYFTGVIRMRFREAFWWNLLGSILWCVPIIGLGVLSGHAYRIFLSKIHHYLNAILLLTGIGITVGYLCYRFFRARPGVKVHPNQKTVK
ncbi:MAG: DedA family protein [Heliobacteriaceae bacterium]|nr:DedA family protein [Heliobacteriaceae bacterium]MDD4587411.1 DedA family protein [Heliobacteriaceae bacterium]